MSTKPNLFKLATKELSQDALFTWLLEWSSPTNQQYDATLHDCGRELLSMLMTDSIVYKEHKLVRVEADRQWDGIDIYAELFFENDKRSILIIEDKTYSSEHSNQLIRYKEIAEKYVADEGLSELVCAYVKIGGEPQETLKSVAEKGFKVFDRHSILNCLMPYQHSGNSILTDFIEHVQGLHDSYNSFQLVPPSNWNGHSWVGFFQFIESKIEIIKWHWVNNPGGGFWNLCLTWKGWNNFPVYMQLEEEKLCFKIALSEDQTELDNNHTDINGVQDQIRDWLFSFVQENQFDIIRKPNRYAHQGNYRTFAVIDSQNWLGNRDEMLDPEGVVTRLKKIIHFYGEFIDHIGQYTYESTGLAISEYEDLQGEQSFVDAE